MPAKTPASEVIAWPQIMATMSSMWESSDAAPESLAMRVPIIDIKNHTAETASQPSMNNAPKTIIAADARGGDVSE